MWCRHCQQDVPAARGSGPPSCSRCAKLEAPHQPLKLAAIADCGVSLEEFDRQKIEVAPARPSLVGGSDDLRRLQRMLRPQVHGELGRSLPLGPVPATLSEMPSSIELFAPEISVESFTPLRTTSARRPQSAWGVSLLLAIGFATFACGVGLLVASNMLVHAVAWRWGFAMTIAGEGLLIGGLAAMAVRLWRNSRRINSQLEVIDRRLGDVQASVESVAGEPALISNNRLWRIDASEPFGRLERSTVAVR